MCCLSIGFHWEAAHGTFSLLAMLTVELESKSSFCRRIPRAFLFFSLLQAILFNKGAIDALFHMVPPSTALGSCFAFVPREGLIPPGGLQHIHISFCSTILGQFTEEFGVSVHSCPQPVTLTVR